MSYNPLNPNGQATSANSSPVVLSTTQEAELGIVTETAPATDTASSGLNGRLQRIAQRLTSVIALLPSSIGQKVKADSLSVTMASDQGGIAVTGGLTDAELRATPVPVSGPLTDTQLRATPVPVSAATWPLPTGAATEATLLTRLSESDFDTKIGSLTETAPATDTASSGLNGRLQRVAQNITSLAAQFPTSLVGGRLDTNVGAWLGSTAPSVGQKAMASSIPVVLASDQTTITIAGSVTANAGTNLNTSLLALESGGNLAAAASSLNTIDDWDESDRAKVNPIAGQAGVAGGSGTVSALTQRVVLPTDQPAITTAGVLSVKIDQTTDGTTNKVAATQASAAALNATVVGTGTFVVQATVGAAAANIAKAEDVASANADVGVPAMAVRKATPANTSDADGDYEMLQMSAGRLWVDASGVTLTVGTHAVTGSGTFTTSDTATQVDDAAFTPATSRVMMAGATFDDVAPDSVNEGDGGALRMSANRSLYVNIRDNAGNERGLNIDANGEVGIGAIRTSVTPGTAAGNLGKAEDAAHGSGDTGVAVWAVRDNATSGQPTTAFGANGDYAPFVLDDNYRLYTQTVGNVAHDGVDAGSPVKVGLKAVAHGTNPTAVAANDRTDWYGNRAGVPFVIGGHPNIITKEFSFSTAQTDVALVTVSSGTKIVVTKVSAVVSGATTVTVACRIGFATSTLSAASSSGVTGIVLSHGAIPPGSGVIEGTGAAILGVGADDEDLRITCGAATSGSIRVTFSYYTIES